MASSSRPREPSQRAITTLIHSSNPYTRVSRQDDERKAKDKEAKHDELADFAKQTLMARPAPTTPPSLAEQQQMTERIRSRMSRTSGGRDSLPEFDALVERLSNADKALVELPAMLSFIYQMAFTGRSDEGRSSRASPLLGADGHHRMDRISSRASLASADAAYSRTAGPSRLSEGRPSSRFADHNRRSDLASASGSRTPTTADEPQPTPSARNDQRLPEISAMATNKRAAASEIARTQNLRSEQKKGDKEPHELPAPRSNEEAPGEGAYQQSTPSGPPTPTLSRSELGIGKVPKAVSLERWRSACGLPLVDEQELLRDVIFILQGIDGQFVRFEQVQARIPHDEGVIRGPGADSRPAEAPVKVRIDEGAGTARISLPTRHLIHRLAEGGKHYQRITSFIRSQATVENCGRIMQSLCHFIDKQLAEYYELICDLEAQLNQGPAEPETVPEDPVQAREAAKKASKGTLTSSADAQQGLTLKKVAVLTEQALLRMRLMSSLVEGAQHTHGGSLVSLIHNYTFNGDPFIRSFTETLLEEVSRSFFSSLSRWIYEGDLQDPFREFFVELNPDPLSSSKDEAKAPSEYPDEIDAAALWENKFIFQSALVPTFLGETFARKIFSAGKSLNFIRYSCGDSDWKETRDSIQPQSNAELRYADLVGLERTIDTVHSTVSKKLLDIFLDKFKLQKHLRAINDYLLLTNGDFSELLLESLSGILHKQASLLYRHSLTAALETAIRGSNAQNDDEEVLRRLDARVLEFTGAETGWDTFTLEYRVDSPVNTVLDAGAMGEYQQIFLHLWKMKRVEMCLNASFAKMLSATNGLLRIKKKQRDEGVTALRREAHRVVGLLAEMTHFMRQLQGYNQLEVIEYSWQDLQSFFEKRSGDLDVLIAAHRGYLTSLHGKIFLRGGSGSKRGGMDYLATELRTNFNTILAFTMATDDLSTHIVDFLARRSLGEDSQSAEQDLRLNQTLRNIQEAANDFRERTDSIISRLERHGNLVIRDLSVRLDYNGYYARTRPDKVGGAGGGSGFREVTREPSSGR